MLQRILHELRPPGFVESTCRMESSWSHAFFHFIDEFACKRLRRVFTGIFRGAFISSHSKVLPVWAFLETCERQSVNLLGLKHVLPSSSSHKRADEGYAVLSCHHSDHYTCNTFGFSVGIWIFGDRCLDFADQFGITVGRSLKIRHEAPERC